LKSTDPKRKKELANGKLIRQVKVLRDDERLDIEGNKRGRVNIIF
jgi:hypothetical protein